MYVAPGRFSIKPQSEEKTYFFRPEGAFLRKQKIAETIIYVTSERFFGSEIDTQKTFEKDTFGSVKSSQMLIFKAPGDFCNFQRTRDRGPKRIEKRHPEDPPKTHSKMETEIQETPRPLYISYFGTSCRARKSTSKIRADRKTSKNEMPERGANFQKNHSRPNSPNLTISFSFAP